MSNHLHETVYLVGKSPFHFYQMFSAGLSAFILRKIVKREVNITVAAATRFVDKSHLLDQLRLVKRWYKL